MQIALVVLRGIEVHDHVDAVDIDAPGGHVGGDQDRQASLREGSQRSLSHLLAQVAMDGASVDTLFANGLGQAVGAPLGPGEDQAALCTSADGGGDPHLVHLVDQEKTVGHGGNRRLHRCHLVADRVVHLVANQPVNIAVERGREEHGLMRASQMAQQPFHLRHETHVRHSVGLVEHDHLDLAQVGVAALA